MISSSRQIMTSFSSEHGGLIRIGHWFLVIGFCLFFGACHLTFSYFGVYQIGEL